MCAVFVHVLYVWQRSVCDFLLELATACVTQSPNVSTKATRNKRKRGFFFFFLLPPLDLWQPRPFKTLVDPRRSLVPLHVDRLPHSLTSGKTDPLFAKKKDGRPPQGSPSFCHPSVRKCWTGNSHLQEKKKRKFPG